MNGRFSSLARQNKGRFEISKNVKYIAVTPGASELLVFKEVRPYRESNPGRTRGLVNIRKWGQISCILRIRDNYSKQRPDIENLFTHPWSVSIGKTAFFVFKLLSFYVEWSDQHKFYMKLKEKISTFKPTSKTSISKTKMLWNLIFLCNTSSIFTT